MEPDSAERVIGRLEGIAEQLNKRLDDVQEGQREAAATLKEHAAKDESTNARMFVRLDAVNDRVARMEGVSDAVDNLSERIGELEEYREECIKADSLRTGLKQGADESDKKWGRRTVAVATVIGATAGAGGTAVTGFWPKIAKAVGALFGGHG